MVRRPCPHDHCLACAQDRQDFCFTGDFAERGIKGRDGFMTEQVVEDEKYLVPVPEALREVGMLVEPLTIAEKALIQLWDVQERLPRQGLTFVPGTPQQFAAFVRSEKDKWGALVKAVGARVD